MTRPISFSLLMAVYKKDSPEFLAQALDSVVGSSCRPTQVVVVRDGPVTPELDRVLEQYSEHLALDLVSLPVNQGLGPALNAGVLACREEWIARFDSDDICSATRFEQQLAYIAAHPETSLLGGQIQEFESGREHAYASRIVPLEQNAIYRYAKTRNPFNHMTVMFRKSAVLAAGNYQNDPLYEDYALWIRMIMQAQTMANLPMILVYARAGDNMFRRRGGWKYAWNEIRFQYGFYRKGFLSLPRLAVNIASRVPVRLVPNQVRAFIYRRVLRRSTQ
ncbi:amylovoran biosynthesis glycosyltransferase AmsE [Advenella kashmirensis WT001]|uniref:Amylovoran biosynthesis glycosyltransferase AmsE n=1 Tax=Advenella kashmirensis (strain DSM 17095 / LMG 22695 / WT001) TaxID=1036672 RepID=I3U8T9_ADVKW|nr:glycosyltransferase [Advenella kashmirensis]AFK61427.1 amylovoran biosynthesis glycosyltransferase AmsE [Advenella kashmirensis WT001]